MSAAVSGVNPASPNETGVTATVQTQPENDTQASIPPAVVGSNRPQDYDLDGHYEDVNGDNRINVVDSQALLAHLSSEAIQQHPNAFDFTEDGKVDRRDVEWLFQRAVSVNHNDTDGDGLNNTVERRLGTNLTNLDTDGDGPSDYIETERSGKRIDSDNDGVIDPLDPLDDEGPRYIRNESLATPLQKKIAATLQARNLSALDPDRREIRNKSFERLNATLVQYRDPVRVSSAEVFTNDTVVLERLTTYSQTREQSKVERISRLVASADNTTTYKAIVEAERWWNSTEGEIQNQQFRRRAEANLTEARLKFSQAQVALQRANDSSGPRAIRERVRAVQKLRAAWLRAQLATHELDRGVGTDIRIRTRSDPIRNGSSPVNRTLEIQISDIRPDTLRNLTVTVNGETQLAAPTRLRRHSSTNFTVPISVQLTNRSNNVTVAIWDADVPPEAALNSSTKWSATKESIDTSRATVLFDGDGLNDSTEYRLGTSPLDPDSDSNRTKLNEAGNGTVDGREDFDGDGLKTTRELQIGTKPLERDTDSDGLGDGVEAVLLDTSPFDPDSNDDGTSDGAEDFDGDGLNNSEEIAAGTLPRLADTDRDGLNDSRELEVGTDPVNPDTDRDFLIDGSEVSSSIDTDPLDADTDGDGVVDGNETYDSVAENETLGASVTITGRGNVARQTEIRSPRHVRYRDSNAPSAAVAPFVDFRTDRNFSSALISIEYNQSRIDSSPSNLSIYRFNESLQRYEPLNSTVDPSTNTVRARTHHFSTYTVFENEEWVEYLKGRQDLVENGKPERFENMTFESPPDSINESDWNCHTERNLYPDDRYDDPDGECGFSDGRTYVRESGPVMRSLQRNVSLPSEGPLFLKFKLTYWAEPTEIGNFSNFQIASENSSTFLFRADYRDEYSATTITRRVNIDQYAGETVTLSAMVNGDRQNRSDPAYTRIELHHVDIEAPSNETVNTDSDGDGIPDFREVIGIPLANGGVVETDPNDPDTDGDGIPDGEEVDISSRVQQKSVGNTFSSGFRWSSDPTKYDTDGDGLSDSTEQEGWTVRTINRSGQAYRWPTESRGQNGSGSTIFSPSGQNLVQTASPEDEYGPVPADSTPRTKDSDFDDVSDTPERKVTHYLSGQSYRLATELRGQNDSGSANSSGSGQLARTPPPQGEYGSIRVDSNPKTKYSDFDDISDTEEREVTHTDPSGDVTYGISGKFDSGWVVDTIEEKGYWVTLWYTYVGDEDADEDGFPDELESEVGIPIVEDRSIERIFTDPHDPDTDRDTLSDTEEFGDKQSFSIPTGRFGSYTFDAYPMRSNPNEEDSDEDRLNDPEEYRIGTDPRDQDTDGDNIIDSWDIRPETDDRPPEIEFIDFGILETGNEIIGPTHGEFRIVDNTPVTTEGIEVTPYFDQEGRLPGYSTVICYPPPDRNDCPDDPNRFAYNTGTIQTGFLSLQRQEPDYYWLNVSDEDDNTVKLRIDHSRAGESPISKFLIQRSYDLLFRTQPDWLTVSGGVLLYTTGKLLERRLTVEIEEKGEEQSFPLELANVSERYEGTENGDFVLPTGGLGGGGRSGVERGFGWEYISRTDDISKADIGAALDEETAITEPAPRTKSVEPTVRAAITDDVDDPKLVFVIYLGKTIVRATAQQLADVIDDEQDLESAREFLEDEASEQTRRVITDGGTTDDEIGSALIEAELSDEVSSEEINDAIRRINSVDTSEKRQLANDTITEAPVAAVKFITGIEEDDDLEAVLAQADSAAQLSYFVENADGNAAVLVNTVEDTEYYNNIFRGASKFRSSSDADLSVFMAFETGNDAAIKASVLRSVGDERGRADDITPERATQFSRDVQDLSTNGDVENLEDVLNDDMTASDGAVNGDPSGVKGAMYEVRLARDRIEDPDINSIEMAKEIETPQYSDLTEDEISTLIQEIDFEKGTRGFGEPTRSGKEEIIRNALADGGDEYSEFDVFTGSDEYIEAKNVDDMGRVLDDLLNKTIRYKAHQMVGDVRSSGEIEVVGRPGKFEKSNGGLRKVGKFIENSEGITKDELEW